MTERRQSRAWVVIATIAILFLLALLVVPHSAAGNGTDGLWMLPVFFAGMISPLSLFAALAWVYAGRTPEVPALISSFQRPPPLQMA